MFRSGDVESMAQGMDQPVISQKIHHHHERPVLFKAQVSSSRTEISRIYQVTTVELHVYEFYAVSKFVFLLAVYTRVHAVLRHSAFNNCQLRLSRITISSTGTPLPLKNQKSIETQLTSQRVPAITRIKVRKRILLLLRASTGDSKPLTASPR